MNQDEIAALALRLINDPPVFPAQADLRVDEANTWILAGALAVKMERERCAKIVEKPECDLGEKSCHDDRCGMIWAVKKIRSGE